MILGIGTDIIEIERIKKSNNERFVNRILTMDEQNIYNSYESEKSKVEFLAGRFAAKEAYSKAMGTGIGKLSFKEINILKNELGAPYIDDELYIVHVSISHCESYATSTVILEKK